MKTTQLQVLTVLATVAMSFLVASNAWAAGEPKNQPPFHRGIAEALPAAIAAAESKAESAFSRTRGERQKLVDTTLRATRGTGPHRAAAIPLDWIERYAAAHPYGAGLTAAADRRGEPKNDAPFDRLTSVNTTPAASTASVASHPLRGTSASFHWRDAGIGASLATLLLLMAGAGATHRRPRRPVGA